MFLFLGSTCVRLPFLWMMFMCRNRSFSQRLPQLHLQAVVRAAVALAVVIVYLLFACCVVVDLSSSLLLLLVVFVVLLVL